MGYEGRLIGEKAEIECASRHVWHSRQKITKQIMGENRCNDINFRPLSGFFQKRKDGVNEFEFFPKRGIYASFGMNSSNGEYKE